ncbi:MAG: tetratricopeptide repeat protein [Gemmataceae bacterium]
MTDPHPSADRWREYLAGRVDDKDAAALDAHLQMCAACAASLAALSPAASAFVDRLRSAAGTGAYQPEPVGASEAFGSKVAAGCTLAGRYKLVEEIGEGGMGAVWMAQQTEPVKRTVAVKLIRPGMDSKAVLARFEAERQALALMDHPNIAKVLDAGATPDSRPFFVMELVKGTPITTFCDDRKLTPRERLELFVPVCQAIQHAHQKGVIHRDIKPSNVLVALYDDRPVPKVIDFGVAKATGAALTDHSLMTGFGAVVGTPEYMSPEQAGFNQLDIDTRSDVYALGVLLYELLTGTTPVDRKSLRDAAVLEVLRIVREVEPPRPSEKLSTAEALPTIAANRQTEPAKLAGLFRGELDWVVMKALEKDRARRYETANGLARDLQRYLADEVVEARPPTAGYRVRKFVRRNKGRVAAAALVLLTLVGGIVGTTWGLVKAREQRDAADAARGQADRRLTQVEKANEILGAVFKDLDPRDGERIDKPLQVVLGERLDRAAAQLDGEAIGDPRTVAKMQLTLGVSQLGLKRAEAIPLLTAARATLAKEVGPTHRDTLRCMSKLGEGYELVGKVREAEALDKETLDLQTAALGRGDYDTLETMNNLAAVYMNMGRLGDAIALFTEALGLATERLGDRNALTVGIMSNRAVAVVLAGDKAEAIPHLEKALELSTAARGRDHPDTLTIMSSLADCYSTTGRIGAGLPLFEEALRLRCRRLGPDHPDTLRGTLSLAAAYRLAGRPGDAVPLLVEAVGRVTARGGPDHPVALMFSVSLAKSYAAAGQPDAALPRFRDAARGVQNRQFRDPNAGEIVTGAADGLEFLRRFEEAETLRRVWLAAVEERGGTSHPVYPVALAQLADNLMKQQKWADAERLARTQADAARRTPGPESLEYAGARVVVGYCLLQQNKWADAEPILRESLAIRQSTQPTAWTTSNTASLLGEALTGQQKYPEATPLLIDGYEGMKRQAAAIPKDARVRLTEAALRLVRLYEATGAAAAAARWLDEAWAWAETPTA